MTSNQMEPSLNDVDEIEAFYRRSPQRFGEWYAQVKADNPQSETLRVWDARLRAEGRVPRKKRPNQVPSLVIIALIAGLLVKLPAFSNVSDNWYLARFAPMIVVGALCIFYLLSRSSIRPMVVTLTVFAACAALMLIWPALTPARTPMSDAVAMSVIHTPLVLLSVLAVSFCGSIWAMGGCVRYGQRAVGCQLSLQYGAGYREPHRKFGC